MRLALDPRFQAAAHRGLEDKLAAGPVALFRRGRCGWSSWPWRRRETPAQVQEREGRAGELVAPRRPPSARIPRVKALQERFGATVLPDTIRPTR